MKYGPLPLLHVLRLIICDIELKSISIMLHFHIIMRFHTCIYSVRLYSLILPQLLEVLFTQVSKIQIFLLVYHEFRRIVYVTYA